MDNIYTTLVTVTDEHGVLSCCGFAHGCSVQTEPPAFIQEALILPTNPRESERSGDGVEEKLWGSSNEGKSRSEPQSEFGGPPRNLIIAISSHQDGHLSTGP